MSKIKITYKKLMKELHGKITFDSVVNYLQSLGYAVIYYSSLECNALLKKYSLTETAAKVNAFTFVSDSVKIVFINDSVHLNNMMCSLVHELSHILLGHLENNPYARDKRLNEMEAEALAYQILNPQKDMRRFNVLTICISILCIILSICFANSSKETAAIPQPTVSIKETVATYVPTAAPTTVTENQSEIVYVTPSGTKYHRSDCRYVKNKNCSTYTRAEAEQKYSACSVCRP